MADFAFVFPGQGSQSVGMLDGWGDHPPFVTRSTKRVLRSDRTSAA